MPKFTAIAHPNIAFIKYWGNRDARRRIPLNDSLSMNLDALTTTTTVDFNARLKDDRISIDGKEASDTARARVVAHLDRVRALAKIETCARVESKSNFPSGVGIASSASAFAALSFAASRSAGLELGERALSILARQGSGSACRSIPPGFVEWIGGRTHEGSYAVSIAPPEHWDLRDVVAVVSVAEKKVGSTEGHAGASTSPFLPERMNAHPIRLHHVRRALIAKDLPGMGAELEAEALELHLIAMTSRPPVFYWTPEMVRVIQSVHQWRAEGLPVYFTLDAGPNVHLICEAKDAVQVELLARAVEGVQQVYVCAPGGGTRASEEHLD
jgi:diphosphomevalonate decarboxylase